MATKKRVPEIRFQGFSGEWRKQKLGYIGETFTGLSGKTKADFGHGDGRFITYMNVFSNPVVNPNMVEPVEIDNKQAAVKSGDVLFTTSSETPEEVGMSSVMLHDCENTYLNSFCFGYRPQGIFNNNFLAYMLRSDIVRRDIVFLAQGISRYNISKNKVMEISVPIPEIPEQSQIGSFFQNLDAQITLHQGKLSKLGAVKKSMLEKMFPKEGAAVPEIRFQGFEGKWERKTLGEISDVLDGDRGKNYPSDNEFQERGHTLFLSAANVTKEGFVFDDCQYITSEKSNSLGNGKLVTDALF